MKRAAQPARILVFAVLLAAARAQAAEPVITIDYDETRDAMRVAASIDIAAPPAVVWGVIIDCGRAPQIVPNMESCRVLQRDPGGKWEIRETVLNVMFLPRVRSVVRNELTPIRRLTFKRAGGDMRIADGEWRLEPLANGKATRLAYRAEFATSFMVPQFLVDQAANRDFPTFFHAIERESLADAAKAPR